MHILEKSDLSVIQGGLEPNLDWKYLDDNEEHHRYVHEASQTYLLVDKAPGSFGLHVQFGSSYLAPKYAVHEKNPANAITAQRGKIISYGLLLLGLAGFYLVNKD